MEAIPMVELAYLAGLFDGEGTVGIYESSAPSKHGKRPIWIYQVQIANTAFRALAWVQQRCGGSVVKKSKGKANWRQGYVWRLCGNEAADFLRFIRQYTVIKTAEIDEALKFRDLCMPRGKFQTQAEIETKRGIVIAMKAMKRA